MADEDASRQENVGAKTGSNRTVLKELGGFELLEKIGQGGMGAVFKARQISLDRIVALKILPQNIAKNAQFIERFQREARASAKVSHANVVQGIDVGRDGPTGLWYFAMEFIDGPTLREILKQQRVLTERYATEVVRDIAKALGAVAEAGMVHRDVKPDNVLIAKNGAVKLADLGLATQVNSVDAELTQSGQTVGTPFYMAPEQVRGLRDKIDIRSDIYALGATYFHLVTGRPPFSGTTSAEIMSKHLTENPPKAAEVNPTVSPACSKLIFKMMSKKPEQRPQTPQELLEACDRLLNSENHTTGPRAPVRATGQRIAIGTTGPRSAVAGTARQQTVQPRAKGSGMALVSIAVLLGALAALYYGLGRSQPQQPAPQPVAKSNSVETQSTSTAIAGTAPTPTATVASVAPKPVAPVEPPPPAQVAKTDQTPTPAPTATPTETAVAKVDPPAPKPGPAPESAPAPTPVPPVAVATEVKEAPAEVAKPAPAPEQLAAIAACDKQVDNVMQLLSEGNRKGASMALEKALSDPAFSAMKPRLQRCEWAMSWLTELDHLAEVGAGKIPAGEAFELRMRAGDAMHLGGKDGFSLISAKDGVLRLSQQGAELSAQLTKLHPKTYRSLVERGAGNDATHATALAFLSVLELRDAKSFDAAGIANAGIAIGAAEVAGAPAERVQFLRDVLAVAEKGAAEALAQTKWAEIQKLSAKPGKTLLPLLDEFEAQCGTTALAMEKASEIAQLRHSILSTDMVMQGLIVWLRADAGVNANNRRVRTWEDQSGKNHHAVQHKPKEQPTLLPEGFNGKPALHFNGVESNLLIADVGPLKTYTILWTLKPAKLQGFNNFIGASGGWGQFAFHTTNDGSVYCGTSVASRINPEDGPKAGTVVKDVWQQFTYAFDGATGSLFKNGKLLATKKIVGAKWTDFQIGVLGRTTIDGEISELAIYDRALTPPEREATEHRMLDDTSVMTQRKK